MRVKASRQVLISIDPGLGSTGYAVWRESVLPGQAYELEAVGLLHAPRQGTVPERANALANQIYQLPFRLARIVCEFPEFHGSAMRSMGWKTGDLQHLTFLVGVFAGVLQPATFELVKPSGWKGQLPKPIVIDRIRKKLSRSVCDGMEIEKDGWDAVGIGLWAQGRF